VSAPGFSGISETEQRMKRNLLLFVLALCVPILAHSSDDAARKQYAAMVAQVKKGDLTIDWRQFRLDAQLGGVTESFDWHEANKRAQADFNKGDFEGALKEALAIENASLANLDGHFDAYIAYKHLNRKTEMASERAILDALLKSITDSGDGKTAATAYFTVDPAEEYVYLGLVLGLRPKGQALVTEKDHAYDKMTCVDDSGKEETVWFNTDTDMQIMEAALKSK
jgi:hypothetical protein